MQRVAGKGKSGSTSFPDDPYFFCGRASVSFAVINSVELGLNTSCRFLVYMRHRHQSIRGYTATLTRPLSILDNALCSATTTICEAVGRRSVTLGTTREQNWSQLLQRGLPGRPGRNLAYIGASRSRFSHMMSTSDVNQRQFRMSLPESTSAVTP